MGLRQYIGQTAVADQIEGTVVMQMKLEQAVRQDVAPVVDTTLADDGTVVVNVKYLDAESNAVVITELPIGDN
jgi:hypothetical protein